jgi:hypothetical protein
MALAVDAVSSGTRAFAANATTLTFAHTVSGSDRVLLVAVQWYSTQAVRSVSSVTYNGTAMTLVSSSQIDNGANRFLALYYLIAPSTGTNNVVITLSGTDDLFFGGSVSFTGADQTSPLGTAVTNSGSSTTPSVTLSSAAGEIALGACQFECHSGAGAFSTGDTEAWEILDGTSNGSAGAYQNGAASVTVDWSGDDSGAQTRLWRTSGVPVKPVSGGGGGDTNARLIGGDLLQPLGFGRLVC